MRQNRTFQELRPISFEINVNFENDLSSNEWKISNLEIIKNRLSSWQKEAWNKSYDHKKTTGNSLLKEKILLQKK